MQNSRAVMMRFLSPAQLIVASRRFVAVIALIAIAFAATPALAQEPAEKPKETWQAGVARTVITPEKLMWMSGYASRDHAAEGKVHDLWAKALALSDPQGKRAVVITLDLVGVDRDLSLAIREEVCRRHGLEIAQVAICCSHTHTGPVVGRNLRSMYFLDDVQRNYLAEYTSFLEKKAIDTAGEALAGLEPCEVAWGVGQAAFAVNRRNNPEPDVPQLRELGQLRGPIDHRVPVISVRNPKRELKAVLFGYACHATVLSFYQWSGDYPGFAQIAVEQEHPGATALFWAGCGADQNPLPRRSVEQAEDYGKQLAAAVDRVLDSPMAAIEGQLAEEYAEIPLAFDTLPTRQELDEQAASADKYISSRAKLLIDEWQASGRLAADYPFPVQVWRLGNGPTWVLLGGEVVVDYSLRIGRELGPNTWVAGYANDCMAYIPSRRVLDEGGYEGAGAMVYYGLPTRWGPNVEEAIVAEVHRLVKEASK